MQYRKSISIVVTLLLALFGISAFAASGQGGQHQEFKESKLFRCAKGETKKECMQRFKKYKWKNDPEKRKQVRRRIMMRQEFKFYGNFKERNYRHPMASPDAGRMQSGKGRLTPEQREELRRIINQVNQENQYRQAR